MSARVLVVDDERTMCDYLEAELSSVGIEVMSRTNADEAFALLSAQEVDVVVTDLHMRGMNGLDLCARVVDNRPDIPVIVITAFGALDTAIATIRAGAFDFVAKPFNIEELLVAIERASRHRALQGEVKRLRQMVSGAQGFEDMLGSSAAMKAVQDLISRVADSDSTVLISGESGTGKELVAKALHRRGKRRDGPFVAINCAAMPEALLESELFGHAKGAFTDARAAKRGLFVEASGGTLFLDELGELPLSMQPKLLRALEERTVRPVGGSTEVPFDVHLVTATNRDLETTVAEGRFRDDLFYRINVVRVELPPLRARGHDILLLAQHFVERFATKNGRRVVGLSSAVAKKLLAYAWPGNIRELQNCIEQAVALARYDEIAVDDLPERIRDYRPANILVVGEDPSELVPLEVVERRYILRVLEAAGGNKSVAARILGLDRKTLYRRLESYGVSER
ncbi:MAG: sigma-54-dependent Fis family transcriptional regulator [Myxococcales bacterium]|nr:sigma-54-dependent Fis family transcriptional regulator [Myxococcales bacterium]